MTFRKILIAADQGPAAARAVATGIDLARALGADLALIHVYEPLVAYGTEAGLPAGEVAALAKAEGQQLFDELRRHHALGPEVKEFMKPGHAAETIVKTAKSWHADLIVIGSHGRGGVPRMLLGSVAEAVMRHAACPVLVIRHNS